MNNFKTSSIKLIAKHGVSMTHKSVVRVVDDVQGTVTQTVTPYTVTMYPRQVVANQYNMPTLVGKEVVQFYLANPPNAFTVTVNDTITYNSINYKVQSWQSHMANGEVCLYRIIAVKG